MPSDGSVGGGAAAMGCTASAGAAAAVAAAGGEACGGDVSRDAAGGPVAELGGASGSCIAGGTGAPVPGLPQDQTVPLVSRLYPNSPRIHTSPKTRIEAVVGAKATLQANARVTIGDAAKGPQMRVHCNELR